MSQQKHKRAPGGGRLRNDGRIRRAFRPHPEHADKQKVQPDVQQGGYYDTLERFSGISDRAEHRSQRVVGKDKDDAKEQTNKYA